MPYFAHYTTAGHIWHPGWQTTDNSAQSGPDTVAAMAGRQPSSDLGKKKYSWV